ncbi:RloB family protein [Methanolapillus africanus]|uniref:RloB family protein n=1 Tax=Methanolapillus africanus TaxID=3028297 RepID=UPI0030B8D151
MIIGEGESERDYFTQLKHHIKSENKVENKSENLNAGGNFNIVPDKSENSDFKTIFERAEKNKEDYQWIFCLIDLDHILNHSLYDKYLESKKQIESSGNIFVIESCPCFEFWILLHYEYCGASFCHCDDLIKNKLKDYLPEYKKGMIKHYYPQIKNKQELAVRRSKESKDNRDREIQSETFGSENSCRISFTEMHILMNKLLDCECKI